MIFVLSSGFGLGFALGKPFFFSFHPLSQPCCIWWRIIRTGSPSAWASGQISLCIYENGKATNSSSFECETPNFRQYL